MTLRKNDVAWRTTCTSIWQLMQFVFLSLFCQSQIPNPRPDSLPSGNEKPSDLLASRSRFSPFRNEANPPSRFSLFWQCIGDSVKPTKQIRFLAAPPRARICLVLGLGNLTVFLPARAILPSSPRLPNSPNTRTRDPNLKHSKC